MGVLISRDISKKTTTTQLGGKHYVYEFHFEQQTFYGSTGYQHPSWQAH
jgi:hypothetical protein